MATGIERPARRSLCLIEPAPGPVQYWRGMRTMMRLRRWISIVAVMGVLLHAAFLVRHSLAMADATRQYHAVLADLTSLCRAGTGDATIPASDLPRLPQPSDGTGCPICAGPVSAFAIADRQPPPLPVPTATAMQLFSVALAAAVPTRTACPPARGPPPRA
jgi:hypothetical protein